MRKTSQIMSADVFLHVKTTSRAKVFFSGSMGFWTFSRNSPLWEGNVVIFEKKVENPIETEKNIFAREVVLTCRNTSPDII